LIHRIKTIVKALLVTEIVVDFLVLNVNTTFQYYKKAFWKAVV